MGDAADDAYDAEMDREEDRRILMEKLDNACPFSKMENTVVFCDWTYAERRPGGGEADASVCFCRVCGTTCDIQL